jgi:hypothetical protein
VDHRHAGIDREFPEIFRRAADADLHGALGIEDAVEHGLAEGSAMMELAVIERTGGVAVCVDVNHADRSATADGTQDRQRHRMVAPDR